VLLKSVRWGDLFFRAIERVRYVQQDSVVNGICAIEGTFSDTFIQPAIPRYLSPPTRICNSTNQSKSKCPNKNFPGKKGMISRFLFFCLTFHPVDCEKAITCSAKGSTMRLLNICIVVLLFAQCASAEYRLNYLSSIKVGEFDKDAAENVGAFRAHPTDPTCHVVDATIPENVNARAPIQRPRSWKYSTTAHRSARYARSRMRAAGTGAAPLIYCSSSLP